MPSDSTLVSTPDWRLREEAGNDQAPISCKLTTAGARQAPFSSRSIAESLPTSSRARQVVVAPGSAMSRRLLIAAASATWVQSRVAVSPFRSTSWDLVARSCQARGEGVGRRRVSIRARRGEPYASRPHPERGSILCGVAPRHTRSTSSGVHSPSRTLRSISIKVGSLCRRTCCSSIPARHTTRTPVMPHGKTAELRVLSHHTACARGAGSDESSGAAAVERRSQRPKNQRNTHN